MPPARLWRPSVRSAATALAVCCLLACPAGLWAAWAGGGEPLVLPGATDLVITSDGLLERRLTYRAQGEPFSWRDRIWQRLLTQGWRAQDYTFGTTREFAVTWYSRELVLGPLRIVESAVVGGDPRDPDLVIVEFHRELHLHNPLPWPR